MALTDLIIPAVAVVILIFLGIKIIKNIVVTIIMIALFLAVLYYFGPFLPFKIF